MARLKRCPDTFRFSRQDHVASPLSFCVAWWKLCLGLRVVLQNDPDGMRFDLSHPFAKSAKGWGTRQVKLNRD